jgi:hypothetical protein
MSFVPEPDPSLPPVEAAPVEPPVVEPAVVEAPVAPVVEPVVEPPVVEPPVVEPAVVPEPTPVVPEPVVEVPAFQSTGVEPIVPELQPTGTLQSVSYPPPEHLTGAALPEAETSETVTCPVCGFKFVPSTIPKS